MDPSAQRSRNNNALTVAAAMIAAMFMIAQHIAGKATRDALFLTYFDVSELPKVMIASATVSVVAVLFMSRFLTRHGPARVVPPLYLISAMLLAVQWYMADSMPKITAVALYLHVSVLSAILISGFWSVINERFDPYAAKKVISRLTAAATFGGLLGGIAANLVARSVDTHAILLMLSAMHLACALAVAVVARGTKHADREDRSATDLLSPLRRSAMIRGMALLALLAAAGTAVLDYILKAEASAALSDEELITFFSYFYMAVGLGTFLLQSSMGNRALRRLGLGGVMAVWPLAILATGGVALLLRSLVTVTLMRAAADLAYNSLFRAGFELLYTPIAPADKRAGKVLIDVAADSAGVLIGGLVIMAVLFMPGAVASTLLIVALLMMLVCLTLILTLHRSYVAQLANNLRNGNLHIDTLDVVDATTAHTVATTQTAIERDKLLRDIALYRDTSGAEPPAMTAAGSYHGPVDAVIEAIIELRSDDDARIKRILAGRTMTTELLPHVIPLLADERVLREVLSAGREIATSGAGQLVDALLNPMQHHLVKRRLPLILAYSESPLAVEGLSTGLDSPDRNIRTRCAQGLEAIHRRHPHLHINRERLLHAVRKEARAQAGGTAASDPDTQSVQLIFLLLGAIYEPETLNLCRLALESDDPGLQGTALELLENLLPARTWTLVRALLGRTQARTGSKRSPRQLGHDLRSAADALRHQQPARDDGAGAATET